MLVLVFKVYCHNFSLNSFERKHKWIFSIEVHPQIKPWGRWPKLWSFNVVLESWIKFHCRICLHFFLEKELFRVDTFQYFRALTPLPEELTGTRHTGGGQIYIRQKYSSTWKKIMNKKLKRVNQFPHWMCLHMITRKKI